MTIYNRELNDRLGNLERCAQEAPAGTYEIAKKASETLDDLAAEVFRAFRAAGFKCDGCDAIRDLHAGLYGLLLKSNPELADEFAMSEGFGEAMDGPAAARVKRQAEVDRAALAVLRKFYQQPAGQ